MSLTLSAAQTIIKKSLDHARNADFKPLGVVVLDERGAVKTVAIEDGTNLKRYEIAYGKAHGAIALGVGSRALYNRVSEHPHFITAATHAIGGALIPVPGGVLIRDSNNAIIGAVGVSGETADNDEKAAALGITAAGFVADGG